MAVAKFDVEIAFFREIRPCVRIPFPLLGHSRSNRSFLPGGDIGISGGNAYFSIHRSILIYVV